MRIVLLFLFLFSSSHAFSETVSFEDWLEEEITFFSTDENNFEKQTMGPWALNKVRLRVRPLLGLEIVNLASLEIKPFIEFHFKATPP